MSSILLYLLVAAGLAVIPSMVAQEKGRDMGPWYLYSLLLFPIALLHALFLKKVEQTEKCPRCKKKIGVLVLECPHCSYKLAGEFSV